MYAKCGCTTNAFRILADYSMGQLDGWFQYQKRIPSLVCSRCATTFFIVSLGREVVSACCTTIHAFFESVLFYAPHDGYRTIPLGTTMILQDRSPIQLRMLCRGHWFVGLLLVVRHWDPGRHFSLPRCFFGRNAGSHRSVQMSVSNSPDL